MSSPTLNRQQCRDLDRRAQEEFGIPGIVLMENAGRGVAETLVEIGISGSVVICCGKGYNAGDGFVMARHLDQFGVPVKVLLWAKPGALAGDAATNYHILQRSGVTIEVFGSRFDASRLVDQQQGAAWFVDALLGTGASGEPRPPLDAVIEWLNAAGVPKLAVDVPSGLDCDTGQPSQNTICASHTCTFVAPKTGFLEPGAEAFTGEVRVLDIGLPRKLTERIVGKPVDAS